ncbi:T-box transcription factor TBX21-like [Dromiciops gliroides]|uniref:T-box transcription factor TBX21-like n=1 Tax=Dromiciops gliroides TaxID=33562 RepID=UPI001CC7DAD2|nr:T-box transcription factor TBX21-like [Dromiciops gliroides]
MIDGYYWHYQNSKWTQNKKKEKDVAGNQLSIHPVSPNTGAYWMRQEISFRKLKLTNKKETSKNENQVIQLNIHCSLFAKDFRESLPPRESLNKSFTEA